MGIQVRPNWNFLTNRPTTVAASGLTDAATVTQATNAANPGTVSHFAANAAPAGWLACNGAAVSRTVYAALFAAIGTTYGAGDGSTTFNLPELRGEFLRGLDGGRGVDGGRNIGTAQAQNQNRVDGAEVTATLGSNPVTIPGDGTWSNFCGPTSASNTGTASAGIRFKTSNAETRPRNIAMLACIKF